MGQALVAAAKSVSEDVHVHSLHCYFVRAGKAPSPMPALLGRGGRALGTVKKMELEAIFPERYRIGPSPWSARPLRCTQHLFSDP